MKHKFIYIIILALSFAGVSCESFLNSDTPSKFNPSVLFADDTEAFRAVRGIYARLTEDAAYSVRLNMYYGVNNDVEWSGVNEGSDGGRRDVFTFEAAPGNSEIRNPFNNLYTLIGRANEVIEGMEASAHFQNAFATRKVSMTNHLYGEAKALRAHAYLELVRNWGDIPLVLTVLPESKDETYLGATDRDEILETLINDLIEVEPYMLSTNDLSEGPERVSREFTQGLIARLALTRGGWSLRPDLNNPKAVGTMKRPADYADYYKIANTYLKKIIDGNVHTLSKTDFATVFLNQMQYKVPKGEDMIFEVAMPRGYSSEVGGYIGIKVDEGSHDYGSSTAAVFITPTCYYSFDEFDVRRSTVAAHWRYNSNLYEDISAFNNLYVGKWDKTKMSEPLGQTSTTKSMGVNWPLLRYADVLLLFAETENEIGNGPTAAAREALKEVRRRAFEPEHYGTKVDAYVNGLAGKEAFFNALVDERMWELGGEMVRKYDLIRWNLLGKKIRQMRTDLIDMGKDALAKDPENGITDAPGRFTHIPATVYYINGTYENPGLQTTNLLQETERPGEDWSSKGWATAAMKGDKEKGFTPADWVQWSWRGVKGNDPDDDTPVAYIHPMPQEFIDNSEGKLTNYYGKGN